MNLDSNIKPLLEKIVDTTNKCITDCYLCLMCPCLMTSLIKFIVRDSRWFFSKIYHVKCVVNALFPQTSKCIPWNFPLERLQNVLFPSFVSSYKNMVHTIRGDPIPVREKSSRLKLKWSVPDLPRFFRASHNLSA